VERFIRHDLRLAADTLGKPLEGRWFGARGIHTKNDNYRVVWEVLPDLAAVAVLMVGRRLDAEGRSVYDRPRPVSGL
jgi:hypothetical protein